ncbi:hypothetical protein G7046_g8782 [Stylonectria norvegica]|nr:hypothetical protein G7046_g8782 [Stylonectria norvegica]
MASLRRSLATLLVTSDHEMGVMGRVGACVTCPNYLNLVDIRFRGKSFMRNPLPAGPASETPSLSPLALTRRPRRAEDRGPDLQWALERGHRDPVERAGGRTEISGWPLGWPPAVDDKSKDPGRDRIGCNHDPFSHRYHYGDLALHDFPSMEDPSVDRLGYFRDGFQGERIVGLLAHPFRWNYDATHDGASSWHLGQAMDVQLSKQPARRRHLQVPSQLWHGPQGILQRSSAPTVFTKTQARTLGGLGASGPGSFARYSSSSMRCKAGGPGRIAVAPRPSQVVQLGVRGRGVGLSPPALTRRHAMRAMQSAAVYSRREAAFNSSFSPAGVAVAACWSAGDAIHDPRSVVVLVTARFRPSDRMIALLLPSNRTIFPSPA